jgi:aminopeptidase-like protein
MMNLISYCDGNHSLLDIADLIDQPIWELMPLLELLVEYGLVELKESMLNAET